MSAGFVPRSSHFLKMIHEDSKMNSFLAATSPRWFTLLFGTFTCDVTKPLSAGLHGPQTPGAADPQLYLAQASVYLTGAKPAGVTPPMSSLPRVMASPCML